MRGSGGRGRAGPPPCRPWPFGAPGRAARPGQPGWTPPRLRARGPGQRAPDQRRGPRASVSDSGKAPCALHSALRVGWAPTLLDAAASFPECAVRAADSNPVPTRLPSPTPEPPAAARLGSRALPDASAPGRAAAASPKALGSIRRPRLLRRSLFRAGWSPVCSRAQGQGPTLSPFPSEAPVPASSSQCPL